MDTNQFWKNKQIAITGGKGFIGSHLIQNLLEKRGVDPEQIFSPSRKDLDLLDMNNCLKVAKGADILIHLAAVVGGIEYNRTHSAQIYFENTAMNNQIMEAARRNAVEKTLLVSSACAYPLHAPVPLVEESLFDGEPEPTNGTYGFAKRMMSIQARSYREQYGMNVVVVIPFNAFGPGDDFDPRTSHVIPALIHKCFTEKELLVWGDGTPTRNFLYVEDFVEGALLALEKHNSPDPINIGTDEEISIAQAVETIAKHTSFKGPIHYDTTKPNGQPKRGASIEKARSLLGYTPQFTFEEGIVKTIDWYRKMRKNGAGGF